MFIVLKNDQKPTTSIMFRLSCALEGGNGWRPVVF